MPTPTLLINKFLLVVRASVTQKGALERSLVNMNYMDHSIDGVIFNGVENLWLIITTC